VSVEHRPSARLALIQHCRAQYPRAAFRFAFEAHHVPLDHDQANDVTADDRVYDLKLRSSVMKLCRHPCLPLTESGSAYGRSAERGKDRRLTQIEQRVEGSVHPLSLRLIEKGDEFLYVFVGHAAAPQVAIRDDGTTHIALNEDVMRTHGWFS
jgi:hypothetical protein